MRDTRQVELTDGSPVPEDGSHTQLRADGQQRSYVVLSPEERAKGFVRQVRRSYTHVGIRPKYSTRDLTEQELERYRQFGYVKYEEYPEGAPERNGGAAVGRYWTQDQLRSGCGRTTTMGIALAETYARDPKFYSGTFCCECGRHFDLEEFVWEGTTEIVGS